MVYYGNGHGLEYDIALQPGAAVGTATLGITRPDVANYYGTSGFTHSGWSFHMSTSALRLSQHSVRATAVGPSGTAQVGVRTVTIQ